jgi:hypothetical protein
MKKPLISACDARLPQPDRTVSRRSIPFGAAISPGDMEDPLSHGLVILFSRLRGTCPTPPQTMTIG